MKKNKLMLATILGALSLNAFATTNQININDFHTAVANNVTKTFSGENAQINSFNGIVNQLKDGLNLNDLTLITKTLTFVNRLQLDLELYNSDSNVQGAKEGLNSIAQSLKNINITSYESLKNTFNNVNNDFNVYTNYLYNIKKENGTLSNVNEQIELNTYLTIRLIQLELNKNNDETSQVNLKKAQDIYTNALTTSIEFPREVLNNVKEIPVVVNNDVKKLESELTITQDQLSNEIYKYLNSSEAQNIQTQLKKVEGAVSKIKEEEKLVDSKLATAILTLQNEKENLNNNSTTLQSNLESQQKELRDLTDQANNIKKELDANRTKQEQSLQNILSKLRTQRANLYWYEFWKKPIINLSISKYKKELAKVDAGAYISSALTAVNLNIWKYNNVIIPSTELATKANNVTIQKDEFLIEKVTQIREIMNNLYNKLLLNSNVNDIFGVVEFFAENNTSKLADYSFIQQQAKTNNIAKLLVISVDTLKAKLQKVGNVAGVDITDQAVYNLLMFKTFQYLNTTTKANSDNSNN